MKSSYRFFPQREEAIDLVSPPCAAAAGPMRQNGAYSDTGQGKYDMPAGNGADFLFMEDNT